MSFAVPVCAACGAAAFPPRVLCPRCGGREWRDEQVGRGVVERTTERDGTRIAAVRTPLGPIVVARSPAVPRQATASRSAATPAYPRPSNKLLRGNIRTCLFQPCPRV